MPRYARQCTVDPASIRLIRNRLDLTQAEFADELGVTRRTVARWESFGAVLEADMWSRNCKLAMLERLADRAGVDPKTLNERWHKMRRRGRG